MGFLKELLILTRFEHAIMLAIAVLIAEIIVLGSFPILTSIVVLSLLVPILSEMGSFALNDYLDIETDRLNKCMNRPLVKGTISPKFAFWFSIVCLLLSTILAYFINSYAFLIALLFNLVAILYNWKLKELPLVGNIYIAFTMAIPFIFGNYVVSDNLSPIILLLALLGFLSGLAREIIKSIQDMEGDIKARKSKTLPVIIGKKSALLVASILYLFFVPLTALPFMLGLSFSLLPIALIALADLGILYIVYLLLKKSDKKTFKKARNLSLVCLFIGLIGLLLASLS